MAEVVISDSMTLKEAYEIMKEHYPNMEYYLDMGDFSLYIGLDSLHETIKNNCELLEVQP